MGEAAGEVGTGYDLMLTFLFWERQIVKLGTPAEICFVPRLVITIHQVFGSRSNPRYR